MVGYTVKIFQDDGEAVGAAENQDLFAEYALGVIFARAEKPVSDCSSSVSVVQVSF